MATTDSSLSGNAESTERLRALVARLSAAELARPLGGSWTVGFALAHLAFWDARQIAALSRFSAGQGFPSEDLAANAALEAISSAFDPSTVGEATVNAAQRLDRIVETLTSEQVDTLQGSGKWYAIDRAPHREEHIRQIEEALG